MKDTTGFTPTIEDLPDGGGQRVVLHRADRPLRRREVVEGWSRDEAFRSFFIALLAEAPYAAYLWETPPLTRDTVDRDFEFVWIESASLASASSEPTAFAEHFTRESRERGVATFYNLGKDAILVVPCPEQDSAYTHLGAFSREAPEAQKHSLWQDVGAAVERRLSDTPLWLSTAGLGVYWLHIRLDSHPKYYRHVPYRRTT